MNTPDTTRNENWLLAESLQVTPATSVLHPDHHGVVTARPHPTGWFISARYRPELPTADIQDFAEFVRVRTYLLLENGPQDSAWEATEDGSWRAVCTPSRLDLPDDVEAFH